MSKVVTRSTEFRKVNNIHIMDSQKHINDNLKQPTPKSDFSFSCEKNSQTGIEGPPVSSLNCDRPLHSGSKALKLVMDASCGDNRWTASLRTWLLGCSPLVLPPSQEVGGASASLNLSGCKHTRKVVFQRNHSPSRASKIYGHKAFQITHLCHYYLQWPRNTNPVSYTHLTLPTIYSV